MRGRLCYLICGTHRSGSNLLCEALTSTRLAGHPGEFFVERLIPAYAKRWKVAWTGDFLAYVRGLIAKTATENGVFGAKVMWMHLGTVLDHIKRGFISLPSEPAPAELLNLLFPSLQYVWITREDKLEQAISLWRAKQTMQWTAFEVPQRVPQYDYCGIKTCRDLLVQDDDAWSSFFAKNHLEYHIVRYSELAADYASTTLKLLEALNIDVPAEWRFRQLRLHKQADVITQQWKHQFLAEDS